jgi:hypothetical protein
MTGILLGSEPKFNCHMRGKEEDFYIWPERHKNLRQHAKAVLRPFKLGKFLIMELKLDMVKCPLGMQ